MGKKIIIVSKKSTKPTKYPPSSQLYQPYSSGLQETWCKESFFVPGFEYKTPALFFGNQPKKMNETSSLKRQLYPTVQW